MKDEPETLARRMGPPGSENWLAMLDGAETILREEGHAALTSRRVAEQIGVKQRLVYYYSRTMDDLIVETFKRLSERDLARLAKTRHADLPLREVWRHCIETTDPRLVSQLMALANRIEPLGRQVVFYIRETRRMQVEVLTQAMERSGKASAMAPAGLALLASSVTLAMTRERHLGIGDGHKDVMDWADAFLGSFEGERSSPPPA